MIALQLVASASRISAVAVEPTLVAAAIVAPILVVAVIAVTGRREALGAAVLALFAVLSWFAAPPAQAHDPGQGDELATAQLTVSGDGAGAVFVRVSGIDDAHEREWTAQALVARRAGQVVIAPLAGRAATFDGTIELPSAGLWFVYTELRAGGATAEAWLPVRHDEAGTVTARRPVYLPTGAGERPVGELLAGSALLIVGTGLIGWAAAVRRRRRDASEERG